MPNYKLPRQFKTGFDYIIKLSSDNINKISEVLKELKVGDQPSVFIELATKKTKLPEIELRSIFDTLIGLINIREQVESDTKELVKDVLESYLEFNSNIIPKDLKTLSEKLTTLLKADGKINKTVKARILVNECQNSFVDSRIISDARIVFDNDLEKSEQYGIVIHQLKIAYQDSNQIKEIYIGLEQSDLHKLRDDIQRALKKEEVIRKKQISSLTYIDFNK